MARRHRVLSSPVLTLVGVLGLIAYGYYSGDISLGFSISILVLVGLITTILEVGTIKKREEQDGLAKLNKLR